MWTWINSSRLLTFTFVFVWFGDLSDWVIEWRPRYWIMSARPVSGDTTSGFWAPNTSHMIKEHRPEHGAMIITLSWPMDHLWGFLPILYNNRKENKLRNRCSKPNLPDNIVSHTIVGQLVGHQIFGGQQGCLLDLIYSTHKITKICVKWIPRAKDKILVVSHMNIKLNQWVHFLCIAVSEGVIVVIIYA